MKKFDILLATSVVAALGVAGYVRHVETSAPPPSVTSTPTPLPPSCALQCSHETAVPTEVPTETTIPTNTPTDVPTSTATATQSPTRAATATRVPQEVCGQTTTEIAYDAEEAKLFTIINDYRAQNGIAPLARSNALDAAATLMANDLATHNYFSHTDSQGRSVFQRASLCGYSSQVGENIAGNFATAETVFAAWKSSGGHNANMLSSNYKTIGIGRAFGAVSAFRGWMWVNDFGTR